MDRKEIAKAIRSELKENGINNKQVSVTSRSALYDDAIRVNIKDINISYKLVNEIATKYESIRYDQANGEILSGCNMYVHVEFDYDIIQEAKQNYMQIAEEIIKQGEEYPENESMTVASKDNLAILFQSKWCNGSFPCVKLCEKEEGWEKESCYCLTSIKRYNAQNKEGIAEALLMIACQYGIDVLKEQQEEVKESNIHKETEEVKEDNTKIDKGLLKSLSNIMEITNDLQWTVKSIFIEDNNIHANIINKYGVEKIEGLYAGSDFSEEPTKQMYQLLLKEFNLTEKAKEAITDQLEQMPNNILEGTQEKQEENTTNNINIKVSFNTDKNGIEIHFTDKPSQEIREQIKSNGFRWSKFQKIWYAKDTEERREFLKSIGFLNTKNNNNSESITVEIIEENLKEVEYPEIDIDDIESYVVSEELSKRENNNSMFRSKDVDHTKELQKTLQSANDSVIELCNITGCTPYIEYKAKTYLQSFKKKYAKAYIGVLTHRVNNPSWMITGRGGLNARKYNKKQDQLTNKMKYECQLIDDFNERIEQYKNRIKREQQQKAKANFETLKANTDISNIKFKRTKTDNINGIKLDYTRTVYEYNNYFIVSNYWGKFRIYNSNGKELTSCNSLEDAKITLITLINQEVEQQEKAI